MKYISIILILLSGLSLKSEAQTPNKGINVKELRSVVGSEMENVRVLFVGDDVRKHLDGTMKKLRAWNKAKKKTDVFVVFSEETKKVVEEKVKKDVFLAKSHSEFFTRFWRDQDFLTWIDVKGDDVAFVETAGRDVSQPSGNPVKLEQHPSDTELAEYVTGLTDSKNRVEVLVVGTKVTAAMLDTLDFTMEFRALKKRLTHIVVYSEDVHKVLASQTDLPMVVTDKTYENMSAVGRIKWTIVEAKGSDLIRVRASGLLKSILTPQSQHDKPRE
tara:strand:- start:288 stop:1106 length:819 start_codon:yes stop_codon:yes gene_type:complete